MEEDTCQDNASTRAHTRGGADSVGDRDAADAVEQLRVRNDHADTHTDARLSLSSESSSADSLAVPSALSSCRAFSLPPPLTASQTCSPSARDTWRRLSSASCLKTSRGTRSDKVAAQTASKVVNTASGRPVQVSSKQRRRTSQSASVSSTKRPTANDGLKMRVSSSGSKTRSSGLDASGEYVIMPRSSYLLSFNPEERGLVAKRALDSSTFGGAVPRGYGLCSSPSLGGCSGSLMGSVTGGGAVSRSQAAMLKRAGRDKSMVRLGVGNPSPLQQHGAWEMGGDGGTQASDVSVVTLDELQASPLPSKGTLIRIPTGEPLMDVNCSVGDIAELEAIEEEPERSDVTRDAGMESVQADELGGKHNMHAEENGRAGEDAYGDVQGIGVALSLRTPKGPQGASEEDTKDEIFVSALVPDGGLSRSKRVREGDVLLAVDGHTVKAADFKTSALVSYLGGPAGSVVMLKFRRRGQRATASRPRSSAASGAAHRATASLSTVSAEDIFTVLVLRGSPQVCLLC